MTRPGGIASTQARIRCGSEPSVTQRVSHPAFAVAPGQPRSVSGVDAPGVRLVSVGQLLDDGLDSAMAQEQAKAFVLDAADERELAKALFNSVWELMERDDRTADDDDTMLHMAHASRYHWGQVPAPATLARGEWLCSRVYAVLGRSEPSLYHAQRVLDICTRDGIGDWDLAFAYEALGRASAVAGDAAGALSFTEQALAA